MSFHVGQQVTYRGGRVVYRVTAIEAHMVTMLRADGKDGGDHKSQDGQTWSSQ